MGLAVGSGPPSPLSQPSFGGLTESLPQERTHCWFWKANPGPDPGVGEQHVGGGSGAGLMGLLLFHEADSPGRQGRGSFLLLEPQ